jgi:hypothetical protein
MFKLSPRLFLSPRFLALPAIAVTVIVALAQTHRNQPIRTELTSSVVRATTCASPGKAVEPSCAIARDTNLLVR